MIVMKKAVGLHIASASLLFATWGAGLAVPVFAQASFQSKLIDLDLNPINKLIVYFEGETTDLKPMFVYEIFDAQEEVLVGNERSFVCEEIKTKQVCIVDLSNLSAKYMQYQISPTPEGIRMELGQIEAGSELEKQDLTSWQEAQNGRIYYSGVRQMAENEGKWQSLSFEQNGGYLMIASDSAKPSAEIYSGNGTGMEKVVEDFHTIEMRFVPKQKDVDLMDVDGVKIVIDENGFLKIDANNKNVSAWWNGNVYEEKEIMLDVEQILTIVSPNAMVAENISLASTDGMGIVSIQLFDQLLSEKEVLTTHLQDKIMIQTRSGDEESWTDWQGGWEVWDEEAEFVPDKAGVKMTSFAQGELKINMAGRKENEASASSVKQITVENLVWPAIAQLAEGETENLAYLNKQVPINDEMIEYFQIGETLVVQEEIAGTIYKIYGAIVDIDKNNKNLTVANWHGAIPRGDCGQDKFCFSTQALLAKEHEIFVDIPKDWQQVDEVFGEDPYGNSVVASYVLGKIWTPTCTDDASEGVCLSGLTLPITSATNKYLQYRIIFGDQKDTKVQNVVVNVSKVGSSNFKGRLRHGKTIEDNFVIRPYYWVD